MQQGQPGNASRERERADGPAAASRDAWPPPPAGVSADAYPDAEAMAWARADGEASVRGGGPPAEEPPPWEEGEPGYGSWAWESAINRSLPMTDLDDMTATGRLSAVRPLRPGERLWSAGVSAPGVPLGRPGGAGVAADDQPSARMRALQSGNLARATVIITVFIMVSRVLG